jgi:heavy metal sensor kinase
MRRFNIKAKIIVATTVVLGVIFSLFSLTFYQRVKGAYLGRLDAHLESHVEKLREEVEEQYVEKRFPNLADIQSIRTESLADPHVRLFDSAGTIILIDSLLLDWPMKPWSEINAHEYLFEDRVTTEGHFRTVWAPVEAADRNQFAVQVAYPLKDVEASLALLQLLLLIGIPLTLAISATAIYAIVSAAFHPLSDMVRAAEKVSANNLSERLKLPKGRDEVFRLAASFNVMLDRLESVFKSQKQFVADASHEIRTPLAIIRSELEFAQKSIADTESKESMEIALAEVDRLKRLSDDLLLLAKMDSPSVSTNIQIVRLDELLVDCVKAMKVSAEGRRISLQLNIEEAVELEADGDKLRSAMTNLIDNAVKFSPDGGTVTILERSRGDSFEIRVHNEGEGIAFSDLGNIFGRFHRAATSRSYHDGSGLGLAIVRKIIEFHKGSISVESEPGKGATFTVLLQRKHPR